MNAQVMTPNEIRRAGIQVLIQGLGAVGMVRFLQQSETGWGTTLKSAVNGWAIRHWQRSGRIFSG